MVAKPMRIRVPADDCLVCACEPDGFMVRAKQAIAAGEQIGYCTEHYHVLLTVLGDLFPDEPMLVRLDDMAEEASHE